MEVGYDGDWQLDVIAVFIYEKGSKAKVRYIKNISV